MLQGLYDKGYRYLGLETLASDSLNTTKFATLNSGYYSQEPEFGNFIINEAHHNASHRTFASSLLQGLYDKGYRYLGL
ncbi:hypothetical protein BOQ60_24775, partial [Chryseobacterium sp. CH1]